MNDQQFELHMEALERIRCGIIDVETAVQNIKVGLPSASANTGSLQLPTAWDVWDIVCKRKLTFRSRMATINGVINIINELVYRQQQARA